MFDTSGSRMPCSHLDMLPCPECAALCHAIALAHAGDALSRPPAAELAARIAHYQARAAAGLDLFAAPEPLPLAS
jgi:hypothetical protein